MTTINVTDMLQIYDLLCSEFHVEEARKLLDDHLFKNEIAIVKDENEDITGVAFFWQLGDVNDLKFSDNFPGEQPFGKYLYFTTFFVAPRERTEGFQKSSVLLRLMEEATSRCPGVKRIAFRRYRPRRRKKRFGPRDIDRIHIMRIPTNGVHRRIT